MKMEEKIGNVIKTLCFSYTFDFFLHFHYNYKVFSFFFSFFSFSLFRTVGNQKGSNEVIFVEAATAERKRGKRGKR